MTREEEIIKEAKLNCNDIAGETDYKSSAAYEGFIQGAEWVEKLLKEKLNEFLENTDFEMQYLDGEGFFDKELFIKDINSILNE